MKLRNTCNRNTERNSTHSSDGFALNVGLEDWQVDRAHDCYSAAQSINLPFKLFISFDMTWVCLAVFSSQNRADHNSAPGFANG